MGPNQCPIQYCMVVVDLGAKLITQLRLVLSLRLCEAVNQSDILCGQIKHSKNFTFYFEFMLQNICDDKFRTTVFTCTGT